MPRDLPLELIAHTILNGARDVAPGHFRVDAASPATYPHIDWRAYDRARQRLEAHGFRWLGDVHPASDQPSSMSRANVLRLFASEDGTVTAAFYKLALRWTPMGMLARLMGGMGGLVDFSTAFPDGTVVETSNAMPARSWNDPPFLLREYLPRATPLDAQLARHRERLRRHAEATPGLSPVRVTTLAEVIAATDAMEGAKRAWRRRVGWVTRAELARYSKLDGAQLDELEAHVRAAVAAEPPPPSIGAPHVAR